MRRLVLALSLLLIAFSTVSATSPAASSAVRVQTVVVQAKVIAEAQPEHPVRHARRRRVRLAVHRHHVPRPLSPGEFGRRSL
jgi:hypothetical protein